MRNADFVDAGQIEPHRARVIEQLPRGVARSERAERRDHIDGGKSAVLVGDTADFKITAARGSCGQLAFRIGSALRWGESSA